MQAAHKREERWLLAVHRRVRGVALLGVSLAMLLSSGCATIVKGSSQTLTVDTKPPGATCVFNRKGETIGAVNPTPGSLVVEKSSEAIAVRCAKDGFQESRASLSAEFQPATLGNIILGGVIGIIIDAASGAVAEYPPTVTLLMVPAEFADAETRDAYFAKLRDEVHADAEKAKKKIVAECPHGNCEREVEAAAAAEKAQLADLEKKRAAARLGPPAKTAERVSAR
jgi:hypothetical protein